MKQPKYILIIVVLGIIAFVGWNKIGTSVKDKELVVECAVPEDPKNTNLGKVHNVFGIQNQKLCKLRKIQTN